MPNTNPAPRPQAPQVVNPVQNAAKPNRNLEGKLDRLMFGALSSSPVRFGLE
ncbi:hypothetical protein [Deinococcus sp. UYEF24]